MKMNSRARIAVITVEGFRGSRKRVPLDLDDDCKNIVLFGSNGDGKTTFSDAIEWFFTDRIHYLQREGCGREDYFNEYMDEDADAFVGVKFSEDELTSTKTLIRSGGYSFSKASTEFVTYLEASSKESLILRHHTMREFIDKTKKEKLERLEEIIGFGVVGEARDILLRVRNSLRSDPELASLRGQRAERQTDLVEVLGRDKFDEGNIIDCADRLAKECDQGVKVSSLADVDGVLTILEKRSVKETKGQEIAKLEGMSKRLVTIARVREVLGEVERLVEDHNGLAKEEETIRASVLEKLYKAAIVAIEGKLVEEGKCPICGKSVDSGALAESLRAEVQAIEGVLEKRNVIIREAKALSTKVKPYKDEVQALLATEKEDRERVLGKEKEASLGKMSAFLSECEDILGRVQESTTAVTLEGGEGLEGFDRDVTDSIQTVQALKNLLVETEEERIFYENLAKLRNLKSDYGRYVELGVKIGLFENQVDSMNRVCEVFEEKEREGIGSVLSAISRDVNDFFVFLHPDDNIEEVELVPTEGRGIEFKLKRHGREVSPPLKILSEAHLNSLGICLFLASAKYFNKANAFLVLDDVVTSFDTGHRRPLARLLNEKFPETQFLLFTHDELWFEILKRDLTGGQWVFRELLKWKREEGVDIKDSPRSLKVRIRNDLDENDVAGAANKCRRLIEETLKGRCDGLRVRGLDYRMGSANDEREASELIDALTAYLKGNESLRDRESKKTFAHIRASQLTTNIGSHHRNLTSTSLVRGDVEAILRDIEEFDLLFVCEKCNTEPHKKYSPARSDLKQCKCGDFKI